MKNRLLLLLLLVLGSCGPYVPFRYHPENRPQTVSAIEDDRVTIYLENIGTQYEHLVFDLEVVNHSPETLVVTPQQIRFFAAGKPFPVINHFDDVDQLSEPHSQLTFRKQFASSPEKMKTVIEGKIKAKNTAATLFFIVGAGLLIYDVVNDNKDYHKEIWTLKDEKRAMFRNLLVDASFITADVLSQSRVHNFEDLHFLSYEIFPATGVTPGHSVRGKIFLPLEMRFRYFRIVVPIDGVDYVFDFRKKNT